MSDGPAVAVLGTGIMGAPMAANMAKAGLDVRVWNRTREKAEALASEHGLTVAERPGEAVEGADLVVTVLFDGAAVESVMTDGGALAAMRDDAVWVQVGTVGIVAHERLAKLADERGVALVDAPVLGTRQPAEQGQLTVLAGGADDAKQRAKPVFGAVASKTVDVGPVGAAMRAKLMLNNWVLSLVEATAETMALGETLDLDPKLFLDVIAGGALDSQYAQIKGKSMLAREFPPAFPLVGAVKDAQLILEAAKRHDFDAALTQAIERKMEAAADLGHGDEDIAATWYASVTRAAARAR